MIEFSVQLTNKKTGKVVYKETAYTPNDETAMATSAHAMLIEAERVARLLGDGNSKASPAPPKGKYLNIRTGEEITL